MRELKTGERRLGGVPFNILPDDARASSCSRARIAPRATCPTRSRSPSARSSTRCSSCTPPPGAPGTDEAFHYVIHYADGKDVTLKVTGNNLADWIDDPVARFPLEEDTFTTVAETVKNTQFGQGSIYRMEWSCPLDRRGVEIKSIDFVGGGKAVPILLGITGVVIWN